MCYNHSKTQHFGDEMIDYTLTRQRRKTAVIYVRGGLVDVRAPLRMPKQAIDRFVAAHEKWITDKLAKSREQTERRAAFAPGYGDMLLYRGEMYPIVAGCGKEAGFDGTAFYIPPDLPPAQIKAVCVKIYRTLAKRDFTAKTLALAQQMGVAPARVRVSSAKTRWGSCSAKKSINFSWRLIMAPENVIDYVVVHELAHLTEMNHSARFWAIVEDMLPDYRGRKAKLKQLQHRLGGEDWE